MKNFIIFAIVVLGCWQLYGKLTPLQLPEQLSFVDTSGTRHTLDSNPIESYLIVPWIDNCPFSARSLEAVEGFSKQNTLVSNKTYALYLNRISKEKLQNHEKVKHSTLRHMPAQEDPLVLRDLHEGLFAKADFLPGDLFIVQPGGNVQHVRTREISQAEFTTVIHDTLEAALL